MVDQHITRRKVTQAVAVTGVGGLAGCSQFFSSNDTSTEHPNESMTTINSAIPVRHVESAAISAESVSEMENSLAAELGIGAVKIAPKAEAIDFIIGGEAAIEEIREARDREDKHDVQQLIPNETIAEVSQFYGLDIHSEDIQDGPTERLVEEVRSTITRRLETLNIEPTEQEITRGDSEINIVITTDSELKEQTLEQLTAQGKVTARFSRQTTDADPESGHEDELYLTPPVQLAEVTIADEMDTTGRPYVPVQIDEQAASEFEKVLVSHGFSSDESPTCDDRATPPFEYTASRCQYTELNGNPVGKGEIDEQLVGAIEPGSLRPDSTLQLPVHSETVREEIQFYLQTGALPVSLPLSATHR